MAFEKPEVINKVPVALVCTSRSVEEFDVGYEEYTRYALTFKVIDNNNMAIDNFEMLTTSGMASNGIGVHKYGAIVFEVGNGYTGTILIKCGNVIYTTQSTTFTGIDEGDALVLSALSDEPNEPDQ